MSLSPTHRPDSLRVSSSCSPLLPSGARRHCRGALSGEVAAAGELSDGAVPQEPKRRRSPTGGTSLWSAVAATSAGVHPGLLATTPIGSRKRKRERMGKEKETGMASSGLRRRYRSLWGRHVKRLDSASSGGNMASG